MKVLNLTLTRKWFDMIYSGEKLEEYREVKPYWIKRLTDDFATFSFKETVFNHFDAIKFTNGYGAHRPTFTIECRGIRVGKGNPAHGAPDNEVFILSLGKILSEQNIKK